MIYKVNHKSEPKILCDHRLFMGKIFFNDSTLGIGKHDRKFAGWQVYDNNFKNRELLTGLGLNSG